MNPKICFDDASFSFQKHQVIIQREKKLICISNSGDNCLNEVNKIILNSQNSENLAGKIKNGNSNNTQDESNLTMEIADARSLVIENSGYVTAIASVPDLDIC